jgi:hypothetical protein
MEGDAVKEQPEEEPRGPRADEGRPRAPRRRARWIAAAAAAVAVVIGALLWLNWPAQDVESVTVGGTEYTTNVRMDEQGGYVYAYIPVNTDVGEVVIEVADEQDNREIRSFLDSLDTFTPGEHVLELSDSNLHFIVDGMAEE